MLDRIHALRKRLSRKGFAGPMYQGWRGKLRFAFESLFARRELVFVLHANDLQAIGPLSGTDLDVIRVHSLEMLEAHRDDIEERWYPGLIEFWRRPFQWGEHLFLGFQDGRPVSFNWVQVGSPDGSPVYWGPLFSNEYRILRGGVAPTSRGQGVNTRMKHKILTGLFQEGAQRVYAECYEANVPSVRTLQTLGFRIIGRLEVLEVMGLRKFVRWRQYD